MAHTVVDEAFTSVHDEAVSLEHANLAEGFVTVSDGESAFTEDSDYTIDYDNGTITVLSTGTMDDDTEYYVSYVWEATGYSTSLQVETWLQSFSTPLNDTLKSRFRAASEAFITAADRAIDNECGVPEEFFLADGAEFEETHDGAELGWVSSFTENPFSQVRVKPLLRLNYKPKITVSSVVADGDTLTEGTDEDYIVTAEGIRFLRTVPKYDYGNVVVTYTAGYAETPTQVSNVSAQLAAAIARVAVLDRKLNLKKLEDKEAKDFKIFPALVESCFSESLKAELRRFKNNLPPKVV